MGSTAVSGKDPFRFGAFSGGLTRITFVPNRCGVVDSVGTQVPDVVWTGGELLRR